MDQLIVLDRDKWFKLLQDDGIALTKKEREVYLPITPKSKKKTRMIVYSATDTGSFFYTKIYKLAAELYNKMRIA